MLPIEWSDRPVTKKDLLITLGLMALHAYLTGDKNNESVRAIRQKLADWIAPGPAPEVKP